MPKRYGRVRLNILPILIMCVLSACSNAQIGQAPTPSLPSTSASTAPTTATPTSDDGSQATTATALSGADASAITTPGALTAEQIAEKLRPATVRVVATFGETAIDYEGLGAGTGIVYDLQNGYILTNAHVVEGASAVQIAPADSTKLRSARVVGRAPCDDLAVLKVENTTDLQAAPLGDTAVVKPGAEVVALGYPLSFDLGTDLSVSRGTVSQTGAQLDKYENLIKTDAAINPGNSGGPLINRNGDVIGINTLGVTGAQGQNFAIAMAYARPIMKQLESGNNRNYLGLNLVPNQYSEYFGTDEGLAVIGVASGSPSARAGVQSADLLLRLENTSVRTDADVCSILRSHADGEQLKLTMLRVGQPSQLLEGEVTVGATGATAAPQLQVVTTLDDQDAGQAGTSGGSGSGQTDNPPPAPTAAPGPPAVDPPLVVQGETLLALGRDTVNDSATFRIGGDRTIRILDSDRKRLYIFSPAGELQRTIALDDTTYPIDFAFNAAGDIFVLDAPGQNALTPLLPVRRYSGDGTFLDAIPVDPGISASAIVCNERGDVALTWPDQRYGEVYWFVRRDGANIPPEAQAGTYDEGVVSPRSNWVFWSSKDTNNGLQNVFANPPGATEQGQLVATLPQNTTFFNIDRGMNVYATTAINNPTNGQIDVWRLDPTGRVVGAARLDVSQCSAGPTALRRFYIDQQGTAVVMCNNGTTNTVTRYRLRDANGQPLPDVSPTAADVPWRP